MDRPPRAFVCGHPVAHSLSPAIHGYWLQEHGLAGSYEAVDIAPSDIRSFLASMPGSGWVGGNVTIPHKQAAFEACGKRDAAAEAIGAVNTLWLDKGILCGGNTDALGFLANLDDKAPDWPADKPAVVVGAGGAARAIIHALQTRNLPQICLVNRTIQRASDLAGTFGAPVSAHQWSKLPQLLAGCGLLVNTTSLGMKGQPELEIDITALPPDAVVNDIVYTPLETRLLATARRRGLTTVDGLGMLLHQAVPGFERWFGVRPQVDDLLRSRILEVLEARQ